MNCQGTLAVAIPTIQLVAEYSSVSCKILFYKVSARHLMGCFGPKIQSIIISRECKRFTSAFVARNDRCEHFTLLDLRRTAQKDTCRRTYRCKCTIVCTLNLF